MKLALKIVLSIILIFTLVSGGGLFYLTRGLEAGKLQTISNINLQDTKMESIMVSIMQEDGPMKLVLH